jgi:soluble lytic murein transglycosylase-like protein
MEAAGIGWLGPENMARLLSSRGRLGELEKQSGDLKSATTLKSPEAWRSFWQFLAGGELKGQTMMMNIITPLLDPIMKIAKTLADKFEGDSGLGGLIDKFRDKLLGFNKSLGDVHSWQDFWNLMKSELKDAWKGFLDIARPILDDIGRFFKKAMQDAMGPVTETARMMTTMLAQFSQGPIASLLGIQPIADVNQRINPNMDLSSLSGSERVAMIRGQQYSGLFEKYGIQAGVDPSLLYGIAMAESRFNPNAVSPKGARGLMQFMPSTAAMYGIDPNDPEQSIRGGAEYQKRLLQLFHGDRNAALAGYNWGEGKVQAAQRKYGADWLSHAPRETQEYIQNVNRYASIAARNIAISVSAPAGSDVTVNTARATGAAAYQ